MKYSQEITLWSCLKEADFDPIELTFIVNGEEIHFIAYERDTLTIIRHKILALNHNTGRPPEEWEIRNVEGARLDPEKLVQDYHFANGERLFLTLKVGIGANLRKIPDAFLFGKITGIS
jgi:hypothetical protein